MRPDDVQKGSPQDWLKRAKSNLVRARQNKAKDVLWEDHCFDCQQAAEKAVKAVLVLKKINFRFVHDLGELLATLERDGIKPPEAVKEAVALTDYAVESRYPGPAEPVTEEEFKKALKMAVEVFKWSEGLILLDPPVSG